MNWSETTTLKPNGRSKPTKNTCCPDFTSSTPLLSPLPAASLLPASKGFVYKIPADGRPAGFSPLYKTHKRPYIRHCWQVNIKDRITVALTQLSSLLVSLFHPFFLFYPTLTAHLIKAVCQLGFGPRLSIVLLIFRCLSLSLPHSPHLTCDVRT